MEHQINILIQRPGTLLLHCFTAITSSTLSHPCRALSPALSFFRALKPTFSLFVTFHKLSAFPTFSAPSRPASFSSWINATKHLIIRHHLRVLVLWGYITLLLYFAFIFLWMENKSRKSVVNFYYVLWEMIINSTRLVLY